MTPRFARCFGRLCALLCLCALLFAAPALAAEEATLAVVPTAATDGTVTAKVELGGVRQVSGVQFAIGYDASLLRLTSSADGAKGDLNGNYTINTNQSGVVRVVWYNANGTAVNGATPVVSLTFAPRPGVDTTANFTFENTLPCMVVDNQLTPLSTTTQTASVAVKGGTVNTDTSGEGYETGYVARPSASPALLYTPAPSLTPAPVAASASPTPRLSATPAQTDPANAQPSAPVASDAQPTATPMQLGEAPDYDPPMLAADTESAAQGAGPAQIEVMGGQGTKTPVWPFLVGGLLVCCGVGYYLWRRRG